MKHWMNVWISYKPIGFMQQNRFVEFLQNILERGRNDDGMTGFKKAVSPKRKNFKKWKAGRSGDNYQSAGCAFNLAMHLARNEAEKNVFETINRRFVEVYRIAKQMRRDNQDVIGDKQVRNDNG